MTYKLTEKEQRMSDELFRQVHKSLHKRAQGGGNAKYRSSMRAFCNFVAKEYRMRNLRNISNKHLAEFVKHRQSLGVIDIHTELSAVRKFHSKLENPRYKELEKDNKALGLERRKNVSGGRNVVSRAWTDEEFQKAVEYTSGYEGKQDIATALKVARYGGLRINEVTALSKQQIREGLKHGHFTVTHAKGGIKRTSFVQSEEYRKALQEALENAEGERVFLKHGRNHAQANKRIQNFIANHRDNWSSVELDNANRVDRDNVRVRENLTFHGLRHSFARELYRENLKTNNEQQARKIVAERLGHNRDEVTKIYL